MTHRQRISNRKRLELFEAAKGICHICEIKIRVGEAWDLDHVVPLGLGGLDDEINMRPAHEKCHARKTSRQDVPDIAKSERVHAKHTGAWRSRRPMLGSKASGWKLGFDGKPVRRS